MDCSCDGSKRQPGQAGLSVTPTIRNWLLARNLDAADPACSRCNEFGKGIDTRLGLLRGSMEGHGRRSLRASARNSATTRSVNRAWRSASSSARCARWFRRSIALPLRCALRPATSQTARAKQAPQSVRWRSRWNTFRVAPLIKVDLVASSRVMIDEMDALIHESAESSKATQQRAADAMRLAESGVKRAAAAQLAIESVSETAEQSAAAINSLNDQSGDIDRIVTSIQAIAEQTNLLSFERRDRGGSAPGSRAADSPLSPKKYAASRKSRARQQGRSPRSFTHSNPRPAGPRKRSSRAIAACARAPTRPPTAVKLSTRSTRRSARCMAALPLPPISRSDLTKLPPA